ncbi:MAG TPA: YbaK/EbsC family protein [Candidatus Limnocylindrales bacterium]|nr:YbaK/EbsC family protein [Candidatus Limnocylindrales bacterium]
MLSNPTSAHPGALPRLLDWLRDRAVEHDVHEHAETFTARQTARAEGVDPHTFAKVVAVRTDDDGQIVLLVLDATDRVDLRKAREALVADDVRLLTEAELATFAPECDPGATPAVGALFDVPMVADRAIRDADALSFSAGTHRCSVRVDRQAWEHATGVRYADLAEAADERPAWARS